MPSSKKKNNKKKVLKGGRSCPVGSQKVCISKGELVKLLKRAAIKKQKTRKKGPKANKVVAEKKTKSVYESIFGSKEETDKPKTTEEPSVEPTQVTEETPSSEPIQVTEEPSVEPATSVETQPQKETSFLGSIFGSNEKPATPVVK